MTVTNEDFFKKRIGEIGFHHQSGHHDFIYFVVVKRSVSEVVGLDTFSEFGDHHIERKVVNLIKKIDDGSMSIFHVIEGLLTMLFNTSLQEGKNLSLPISVVEETTASSFPSNFREVVESRAFMRFCSIEDSPFALRRWEANENFPIAL